MSARKPDALDALLLLAGDATDEGAGVLLWRTNCEEPAMFQLAYSDDEIIIEGDETEIRTELEALVKLRDGLLGRDLDRPTDVRRTS
jgi:hypothetical protein